MKHCLLKPPDRKIAVIFIKLLVVFAFLAFSGREVLAISEVANSCAGHKMTLTLLSPMPEQEHQAGENVSFIGKIWQPFSGVNTSECAKLIFFIAPDIDILPKDCCGYKENFCCEDMDACGNSACFGKSAVLCENLAKNAYGAGGKKSCQADDNAFFAREVKFFDYTENKKIIKLGELYPEIINFASNSGGYAINFDKAFQIPSSLSASGPVRFYVQYSGMGLGTNGKKAWQWFTAYQKGKIVPSCNENQCAINTVGTKVPITIRTSTPIMPDYCTTSSGPAVILGWVLQNSTADEQTAYEVQITANPDFSKITYDSGKIMSSSKKFATPAGKLTYDMFYHWRVKIWGEDSSESAWTYGTIFTTAKHPYPSVKFSWLPKKPSTNQKISFSDESQVWGGTKIVEWSWDFEGGTPKISNEEKPKIIFDRKGIKKVTLRVTDSDGYFCFKDRLIMVTSSAIDWEESY